MAVGFKIEGTELRFNVRSAYRPRRVHVPVEANADQYETGKVQAEYPKERHDATERIAEQPFHGPRPRDFQRHHQERHLKQNKRALYTHGCGRTRRRKYFAIVWENRFSKIANFGR